MSAEALHADARAVLEAWVPPDGEQDRLRALYLTHLAARPDAMWRTCHPDHLTGSALIVSDERVLLVKHRKARLWLQTGGHCEPVDRTLAEVALREAREESGIDDLRIDPIPLRLSRHVVPFCGPEQPAHHLDVQFLAVASPTAEAVRSSESDAVAWFRADEPPEPTDQDVRDLMTAASSRRRETPSP